MTCSHRLLILALGLGATMLAASASAAADPAARRGQALVQRNCAMCHAVDLRGASPNPQAPPFRSLHENYAVEGLAEALAEGILTGHPAMPEFRFAPREVNDIIVYLKTLELRPSARRAFDRGGG